MPRAHRHLTWRVVDPDSKQTSSLDSELQALVPSVNLDGRRWHWVTIARGNGFDLGEIAKALNRARFTLFDIRPVARRKR